MKIALFCENRYAIDILEPLYEEALLQAVHEVLWYIHAPKIKDFKLPDGAQWTHSIQELYNFGPHAIFVPGNIVPYYLPGVKIQVFHGYAAEKKDHWVIRRYFDTYFTQGPYFTSHFDALSYRYGDFEVRETGWTKQDWIFNHLHDYDAQKASLLAQSGKSRIVLYAPTFSPKLTSLPYIKPALEQLCQKEDILLILKFHPLTAEQWTQEYSEWAQTKENVIYVNAGHNITTYQMMSDLMISDTSSSVYEFLLLDRPVVTFRTIAKDIYWENVESVDSLVGAYERALSDESATARRRWVRDNYDPHLDGLCCRRMIAMAQDYIDRHGVPVERKLNLWRKYASIKTFGTIKRD